MLQIDRVFFIFFLPPSFYPYLVLVKNSEKTGKTQHAPIRPKVISFDAQSHGEFNAQGLDL